MVSCIGFKWRGYLWAFACRILEVYCESWFMCPGMISLFLWILINVYESGCFVPPTPPPFPLLLKSMQYFICSFADLLKELKVGYKNVCLLQEILYNKLYSECVLISDCVFIALCPMKHENDLSDMIIVAVSKLWEFTVLWINNNCLRAFTARWKPRES